MSDFQIVLEEACSGLFIDNAGYYRFFGHKFLYPFILYMIGMHSQLSILLFQSICSAINSIIIYLIGKELNNEKIGIIACLLYLVWPAQIVYTAIITEEHFASIIVLLTVLYFIKIINLINTQNIDKSREVKLYFMHFTIIGLLCGLATCFKDWCIIAIIAFAIIAALKSINIHKKAPIIIIGCIWLLLLRIIVSSLLLDVVENKIGMESNNNVVFWQIFESMTPTGTGAYDGDLFNEYFYEILANEDDIDIANKIAFERLKNRIQANIYEMPQFMLKKGQMSYSNDNDMFYWVFERSLLDQFREKFYVVYLFLLNIDMYYYAAIIILLILSILLSRGNHYRMFINMIIIGSMLVGQVIEAQGRYKYSIEPLWTISISIALLDLYSFKSTIKSKYFSHRFIK